MRRRLRLYGRPWCHLCEAMEQALLPVKAEFGFDLEIVDVDTAPDLEHRYGERVPVLAALAGEEEVEICHYHLDLPALSRFMRQEPGEPLI